MSTAIDFRTIPDNIPSICIPRVFTNITDSRIRKIFTDLKMGEIDKIDFVSRQTEKGEKFNRVFIHFKRWNINGDVATARERLLKGQDIKIVYDDPWFWKISAYRPPQSNRSLNPPSERQYKSKLPPRLELEEKVPEKQGLESCKKMRVEHKTIVSNRGPKRNQPPKATQQTSSEKTEIKLDIEESDKV